MVALGATTWMWGCAEPAGDAGGIARQAPIDWRTSATLLRADALTIDAGGLQFTGAADEFELNPGPVVDGDTTVEAIWREHDLEMRINIYLHSDGVEWWSDEIRTYDGTDPGEWITHTGDFFRSPIDLPFEGDLALPGLTLRGVFMTSFLAPDCDGSPYFLETLAPMVDLVASPTTGFGLPARVRDAACNEIAPPPGATFEWSVFDPAVASARPAPHDLFPAFTLLKGVAPGETMGQVVLRDADGNELASRTFPVIVEAP